MSNMLDSIIKDDVSIIPISTVASILQVHQRTLRIYDEENLVRPKRSTKGRRLYCKSDIDKGLMIQFLTRDLGLTLNGVKLVLNMSSKLNITDLNQLKSFCMDVLNLNQEDLNLNNSLLRKRGRKPNINKKV